jgi:hypothetical protein
VIHIQDRQAKPAAKLLILSRHPLKHSGIKTETLNLVLQSAHLRKNTLSPKERGHPTRDAPVNPRNAILKRIYSLSRKQMKTTTQSADGNNHQRNHENPYPNF